MPPSAGDAAAATTLPPYPAWVLLEKEGYDGDLDDATSATCQAINGRVVTVAFNLVPPPAVSNFCVHLSKFEDEGEDDFDFQPLFVFSAKDLVLFRFHFISRSDDSANLIQYFVYKAGGGNPSLKAIPSNPLSSSMDSICVSIVHCHDDEDSYVLADLSVGSEIGHYNLHVYSSKTCNWNSTPLQLLTSSKTVCRCRNDNLPSQFHKVIALGAGEVGWVDLWRGIVTCKVLDNDPVLRLIPLPKPDVDIPQEVEPGLIRDVTYCTGLFKFIEIEEFCRPVRSVKGMIHDYAHIHVNGMAHDPTLIHVDAADEDILVNEGWNIRTCYRIDSCDFWFRAHTVHVDDITVDNLRQSILFPHIWYACAQKSKFGKLTTFYPIFGIPGDSLVYLLSKVKFDDNYTCIVGVDLEEKMVKLIEPCAHMGSTCIQPPVVSSAFSCYLNSSPGYFPATSTNHSDNAANNAAIHGDSSVPELDIHFDPWSCAGEDASPASGSWDSGENNLPRSHEYADVQQTRILQYLDSILMKLGSGNVHATMIPELKTDADAFSCYLNSSPGYFPATSTNHSDNAANNAAIHGDSSVPELDIHFDPWSCAGEDASPASGSWDSGENNLPRSHEYADVQQTRIVQYLNSILMKLGSGNVLPTMTPELETDADGNLWITFPLDDLLSQLPLPGPELASMSTVLSCI